MAFEFFDYDPVTGVTEYMAIEDGKIHIRSEQDVTPYIEYAQHLAKTGATDTTEQKKADFRLYAMLPPVVVADMFKRGINLMDPSMTGRVLNEINTNYPYLKCTTKHHSL